LKGAIRIAVDGMGGDHAPSEIVKGAVEAALQHGVEVVLVGRKEILRSELARCAPWASSLPIADASQVVGFHESPAAVVRDKRDSSIVVAMNLLKGGEVSALVSAGNSGAVMAAALLILGSMKGFDRPALGALFPTPSGTILLLDAGANVDCKPDFLVQFAHMGSIYMENVFKVSHPRIGLLNNGEEETKGNRLTKEAHKLLRKSQLNFIGNIEGKDIFRGLADVVVTDGFTGNVLLKASEGFSEIALNFLKQVLNSKLEFKVPGFFLAPALEAFAKRLDYSEYGGVPLLGVNGNVIIAHGRSDAKAIKNAIRIAKQTVEQGMPDVMRG